MTYDLSLLAGRCVGFCCYQWELLGGIVAPNRHISAYTAHLGIHRTPAALRLVISGGEGYPAPSYPPPHPRGSPKTARTMPYSWVYPGTGNAQGWGVHPGPRYARHPGLPDSRCTWGPGQAVPSQKPYQNIWLWRELCRNPEANPGSGRPKGGGRAGIDPVNPSHVSWAGGMF